MGHTKCKTCGIHEDHCHCNSEQEPKVFNKQLAIERLAGLITLLCNDAIEVASLNMSGQYSSMGTSISKDMQGGKIGTPYGSILDTRSLSITIRRK